MGGDNKLPIINENEYVEKRQAYDYNSSETEFEILQTGNLTYVGNFKGIFAKDMEDHESINLRKFEFICLEVFEDALNAEDKNSRSEKHNSNIKNISQAIVHWKMASQGGRSKTYRENMLKKFNNNLTTQKLLDAFREKDLTKFRIGGVRIPTATAFLRFLFPDQFGIMDSRVVGKCTEPNDITTLSIRQKNGYINDTSTNISKFYDEYIPFLSKEAAWLNSKDVTFKDVNHKNQAIDSPFRVCDVEMALFIYLK